MFAIFVHHTVILKPKAVMSMSTDMRRKLPIGIQNFEFLRSEGYLYIDKTALIYRLVTKGKPYFLSRPRRFGKSLLLSTLEAYFKGKKELFKGLAIEQLEQDWFEYPVLHLDLNAEKYDSRERLEKMLELQLESWEEMYALARFSMIPSRIPPINAPGIEPIPPNTAATNALIPGMEPVYGDRDGYAEQSSTPATAARAEPIAKVTEIVRFTLIPIKVAAPRSSETASIA